MGCKASKPAFSPNELEQGKDAKSIEVLQNMLDFTQEDLNNYHDIFLQINDGLDGVFPIQDVIKFLRLHDNDLVKGILKFFDTDASGGLDFLEFCCAVWNFLSISDIELSRFGFFLVTKDLEGEMTAEMFKNAIELITGKKVTGNVKTAYDQQCLASNDVIDLTNWVNFNVKYSFMISNLKVMQVSMAKVIFGQPYWNKEVQKRKNDPIKSKFKYVLELIKVVEGNNARSKKEAADARFRKNNEKKRLEAIGGNQLQSQNQAAILGAMGMDARKNAESQKRQGVDAIYDAHELDKISRENRSEKAKSGSFIVGKGGGGGKGVVAVAPQDPLALTAVVDSTPPASPKKASAAERITRKAGGLAAKAG